MSGKIKYAFIDRDGTLIEEPADEQIDSLEKVALVKDVIPALRQLQQAGYRLIMVSNQDGLGTDSFPQAAFDAPHKLLRQILSSQGIRFAAEHFDPHFEHEHAPTRKPGLGMLLEYLRAGDMDFQRSVVIGDRQSDLELAANLGVQGHLLDTGHGWLAIVAALLQQPRTGSVQRQTNETSIRVRVNLDQMHKPEVTTGIGFFDHMLEQLAIHANFGCRIQAQGDLHIDEHHTVEDVALALGQALDQALGDRRGVGRYGFVLPMDEALAQTSIDMASINMAAIDTAAMDLAAVDLSGRPWFVLRGELPDTRIGELSTAMVQHFFHSLAQTLRAAIHIDIRGDNAHHMVEGMFKCCGRALRPALAVQADEQAIPSSKGLL
ncbi:MAG: bifunctional histidinol-phosphatase/imidazoleglycerol-phosphate dehydratase HisB [Gammaproteobacteria bacterium]|jgi:imidazoleglycerol-phosphate dehydratase/histidinol-phosphatase|nr:bifunctional histidinol-phosphatase/imidazoleglycerol-phosphate dehydratase HisB [Gammaproteobacteria bacterium]